MHGVTRASSDILALLAFATAVSPLFLFGGLSPRPESLLFRPVPDAAEQNFMAWAMATGHAPLLPIVHEVHPAHYSPVAPFATSLWMRLAGGSDPLSAAVTWPPAALLLGALCLWRAMGHGGMPTAVRATALLLVMGSPALLDCGRMTLQEPTMFLLFAAGAWAWAAGASAPPDPAGRALPGAVVRYGIAGFCHGALFCIRPSTAPLTPAVALGEAWRGWRAGRWRDAGLRMAGYAAGWLAAVSATGNSMRWFAGEFALTGYRHWIPDMAARMVAWSNLRAPINTDFGRQPDHLRLLTDAVIGWRPGLSPVGYPESVWLGFGVVVFPAAMAVAAWRRRSEAGAPVSPHSALGIWVCLLPFCAFQVVFHACYRFYDLRFQVLTATALSVAAVAGLWRCARLWVFAFGPVGRPAGTAFGALLFAVAAVEVSETCSARLAPRRHDRALAREADAHATAAHALKGIIYPVAVDGVPVLNARMSLRVGHDMPPVLPLVSFRPAYLAGELDEMDRHAPPALAHLPGTAAWPRRAHRTALIDGRTGALDTTATVAILETYGGLALYYPVHSEAAVQPALDLAASRGDTIDDRSRDALWRLVVITARRPIGVDTREVH